MMKRLGILALVMVFVLTLMGGSFAEEVERFSCSNVEEVEMYVMLNDVLPMEDLGEYEVVAGDKIVVSALTTNGTEIAFIGYYYYDEGFDTIVDAELTEITIDIPEAPAGTERLIAIEAVTTGNTGVEDGTNRTGWQFFYLRWVEESPAVHSDTVVI